MLTSRLSGGCERERADRSPLAYARGHDPAKAKHALGLPAGARARRLASAALVCAFALSTWAAPMPFRVGLIAGAQPADWEAANSLTACQRSLEEKLGATVVLVTPAKGSNAMPSLLPLRSCDAALLYGGGGELG